MTKQLTADEIERNEPTAVCPKCGAKAEAANSWTCGSWYQHGLFRSEKCRDQQITQLQSDLAAANAAKEQAERDTTSQVVKLTQLWTDKVAALEKHYGDMYAKERGRAESAESELTALRDKLAAIVGTYPQREMMLPHINAARSILNPPPPGETK